MKFFLNTETRTHLRSLADEFGESTNSVRLELNKMTKAGLLTSEENGRTKQYRANTKSPLFPEVHTIVKKTLGIDIVEAALEKLGDVEAAYITGDYARGLDSGIIDVVIVGNINRTYLNELIAIAEEGIKRKVRILVLNKVEFENLKEKLKIDKSLVLWK